MPRVLEESEIDLINEEVDAAFDEAEAGINFLSTTWQSTPDLTDGGRIGAVNLHPTRNGVRQAKGRPVTRMAYMWNGTPSELMLAWNPNGTRHDGARAYLSKRFCLCCHVGGFKDSRCPSCIHNSCSKCTGSTDQRPQTLPNGQVIRGWIIPCFYLKKQDVPFNVQFYGSVNCFLPTCIRQGDRGFLTEADMRFHASSRHRREYQAYQESSTANSQAELESLRRRLDALQSQPLAPVMVAHGANDSERQEFLEWKKRQIANQKRKVKAQAKAEQSK